VFDVDLGTLQTAIESLLTEDNGDCLIVDGTTNCAVLLEELTVESNRFINVTFITSIGNLPPMRCASKLTQSDIIQCFVNEVVNGKITTSTFINHLKVAEKYYVRVSAFNIHGFGAPTPTRYGVTKVKPYTPTQIDISTVSSSALDVFVAPSTVNSGSNTLVFEISNPSNLFC
jgi:hypothetical protein